VNFVSVSMVKRVFPILFLLIYSFSVVVGSTVGRVQAWAAERPASSKHHSGPHAARISEVHKRPVPQVWQNKILKDGGFVVSPFVRTTPPHFATALQHFSADFSIGHSAEVSSTRAPPVTTS